MARSEKGASPPRAAIPHRRDGQPPLRPRAWRVASILAPKAFGVARLVEIAADIDPALAPWPAQKSTATRPTPVFQQSRSIWLGKTGSREGSIGKLAKTPLALADPKKTVRRRGLSRAATARAGAAALQARIPRNGVRQSFGCVCLKTGETTRLLD